ncbi:MAG: DUF4252 domain-containing protein [Bacteroidales bacterium]|nr:DUF4252 domain-containing protein [Bacteroidales bacterium]
MKKLILITTVICLASVLNGQTNPVEEMFDKYSEKEGFTTVYISGRMFNLFSDKSSEAEVKVMRRLKGIRILTVEDPLLNKSINFYTELSRKLDKSAYEELMVVKEKNEVTRFLIRQKGDTITELLVVSGGPEGNVLISITGDLDLKAISELSKTSGIDELKELENIEKKSP